MLTGLGDLLRYTHATAIVGDILKMRASDIGLGDMAIVEMGDGEPSLAQVIQLEGEEVSLQVFGGGFQLSDRFLEPTAKFGFFEQLFLNVDHGSGDGLLTAGSRALGKTTKESKKLLIDQVAVLLNDFRTDIGGTGLQESLDQRNAILLLLEHLGRNPVLLKDRLHHRFTGQVGHRFQ